MNPFPARTSSAPLSVPGGQVPAHMDPAGPRPFHNSKLPGAGPRHPLPPAPGHMQHHHHHMHHHALQHHGGLHHHQHHHHLAHRASAAPPPDFFNRNAADPPVTVVTPTTSDAPRVSPAPTPAVVSLGASPTMATAPELPTEPLVEHPSDLVYDPRVVMMYRETTDDLPESIRKFGMELWGKMPDVTDRPDHMQVSRDDLFSGAATAPNNRLIRDRHLHHEVRGILARVTPEKYAILKDELLALPIRQSDEADIKLVVETFFQKAIRPEDAPYAEFYIKLISDMIQHIGHKEAAGTMIRKEIVTQCQAAFESENSILTDPESVHIEDMDPEEFETKRKMIKDKNKANINLLGLLYINGLVNERVVTNVLFILLYGPEERRHRRSRHTPADFEVEMFIELLLKIGRKISEHTSRFLGQFITTMTELSSQHPSKRIQFLLLDSLAIIENGFEPKKKNANKGPKKIADFEESLVRQKDQQRESVDQAIAGRHLARAPGPSPNAARPAAPVIATQPVKAYPSTKEVSDALESFGERGINDAVGLLKELPDKAMRREYCTKFLYRPMTVIKNREQRAKIGEIFSSLISSKIFTSEDIRMIVQGHLKEVVERGEYQEQPKYFTSWAELVRNGEDVISPDLNTYFLRLVVEDENASVEIIQRLVNDIIKSTPNHEPRDVSAKRFRLLPTLLMHRPSIEAPTSAEEERNPDDDVLANIADPEISFYQSLYNDESTAELVQFVVKSPERANLTFSVKVVCAMFSFVRFDTAYICQQRGLKDVLKKLLSFTNTKGPIEVAWLGEVYASWRECDRIPQDALSSFVRWLLESSLVSSASLAAFVNDLAKLGRDYETDAQLLKSFVAK